MSHWVLSKSQSTIMIKIPADARARHGGVQAFLPLPLTLPLTLDLALDLICDLFPWVMLDFLSGDKLSPPLSEQQNRDSLQPLIYAAQD